MTTLNTVSETVRTRYTKTRLAEREIKILIYLWKWKLVSNAAIAAKFFDGLSDVRAYNRLRDLKRAGLIKMDDDDEHRHFAWTLTAKGFSTVRKYLPGLREEGFRSEAFYHDLLVTAFHLGDWLTSPPKTVRFFSEQELRQSMAVEFPQWVPAVDVHRPDGYWGFETDGAMAPVAIEVEINRKDPSAYFTVAEYYADYENVRRIFWLVPTQKIAAWIQTKLSEALSTKANKHNFIVINDFLKNQWQASICLGPERNRTVRATLLTLARETAENCPRKFSSAKLLETRKSFVRPAACEKSAPTPNRQPPMAYSQ